MQGASKREVLVYCPNCSVQNPLDESLLGTSVICIKCGHPFVAKKPKTELLSKGVWIKGICFFGAIFLAGIVKELIVPGIIDNFTPKGREKKDYALVMQSIDEYGIRLRQYGQTMRNSGVLDIYCSQTAEEIVGKKDPKKYRRAIEQALEEAKSLHSWCEQKLKTFNPQMRTEKGKQAENMIREVYTSYYELSTIGIKLFSKTLESHKIHCGMRPGASSQDKDAAHAFIKKNSNILDALNKMDEEIMQIAEEYSSVEEKKFAKMETYRNLFKENKTSSR